MAKNVFITGASGFLGRNFIYSLANQDPEAQLYLLARPTTNAEQSIKSNLEGIDAARVTIVHGDITQPYLGMGESEAKELMKGMYEVWHMAASTSFNDKYREEIRKSNIGGTHNLLETVKDSGMQRFHYVSTAYIAGRNQGIIEEDVMPKRNGFKNSYEESKYDSEMEVRNSGIPFAIYRPSILVGHSHTGDSQGERRMAYGYIQSLLAAVLASEKFGDEAAFWKNWRDLEGKDQEEYPSIPCRLKGYNPSTKNFLCVDHCADSMARIAMNEDVRGKTYHLVNPHNLTCEEMVDSMQKALRLRGFHYAGDITEVNPDNAAELTAFKLQKVFSPYTLNSDPEWDRTNTIRGLGDYKQPSMTTSLFGFLMEKFTEDFERERNANTARN